VASRSSSRANPFGMREIGTLRVGLQFTEARAHVGEAELVHLVGSRMDQHDQAFSMVIAGAANVGVVGQQLALRAVRAGCLSRPCLRIDWIACASCRRGAGAISVVNDPWQRYFASTGPLKSAARGSATHLPSPCTAHASTSKPAASSRVTWEGVPSRYFVIEVPRHPGSLRRNLSESKTYHVINLERWPSSPNSDTTQSPYCSRCLSILFLLSLR
jgi:hypothetical protein